jgi:hypothetical protein
LADECPWDVSDGVFFAEGGGVLFGDEDFSPDLARRSIFFRADIDLDSANLDFLSTLSSFSG